MSVFSSGRLAAIAGAVMLLAGAMMLWVASDNGRAVAVPTRVEASPPPELEEPDLFLEAPEPDLTMPDDPVLRAPRQREKSAEERRFDRLDRNRDGKIQQAEFLAARKRNFDRLDVNGDGVLSFAEYAASGIRRFSELDASGDGTLSRAECAVAAPKSRQQTARAGASDGDCSDT
ncbi:MAG: hypothetical protein ACK4TG_09150, partial [Thermaurantiacus sp.]